MSRNLMSVVCVHCGNTPELVEIPHKITENNAGAYFKEFEGMIVAHATCPSCEADYLAWLDESKRVKYPRTKVYPVIEDLSYYSTFNDEPGNDDLPKWEIQREITL